jgi:leucyl aminopeptidase
MKFVILLSLFFADTVFALPVTVTRPMGTQNLLRSVEVSSSNLSSLSEKLHQNSNRCGGFVASFEGEVFNSPAKINSMPFNVYTIDRAQMVSNLMDQVSEPRLLANIEWFSSYPTRYYLSASGIKAMQDLAHKWAKMAKHLNFASIELIYHKNFKQPSVVLTLQGETDDVIVVGGHGDSINSDDEKINAKSPGADDNASGISVITEVILILTQNDYRPRNTVKFMAYAAEEVGLLGSMDISGRFEDARINVKGVIQFDGTNFKGSKNLGMVLINDHTDGKQNIFIGSLIDKYLKIPWNYDLCGYACSDSYSWTYRGFPASFPAESLVKEENPHIHTALDTLDVSENSAIHSVNFAKLGVAYVIELDK